MLFNNFLYSYKLVPVLEVYLNRKIEWQLFSVLTASKKGNALFLSFFDSYIKTKTRFTLKAFLLFVIGERFLTFTRMF